MSMQWTQRVEAALTEAHMAAVAGGNANLETAHLATAMADKSDSLLAQAVTDTQADLGKLRHALGVAVRELPTLGSPAAELSASQ